MPFSSVVMRGRVGALQSGLGEHGQGVVLSLIPMAEGGGSFFLVPPSLPPPGRGGGETKIDEFTHAACSPGRFDVLNGENDPRTVFGGMPFSQR